MTDQADRNQVSVGTQQVTKTVNRTVVDLTMIFNNFGSIIGSYFGNLTNEQTQGLANLSQLSMLMMYLNLPSSSQTIRYGINNSVARDFAVQFPVLMETFHKLNAQLAMWNPSFTETALLTTLVFINAYSGNDPAMTQLQQQMSNACNLILWKLSNGDLLCFEKLCFHFKNMTNLLKQIKSFMFSSLESITKNSNFFANLYASYQKAEMDANILIESIDDHHQIVE